MGPNPLQCFQAGRRVPGDREVVYRLEADPQGTRVDCYWLSGAGVDRLGRQLAVPEDAGGRARLFASQFLSDLDDLRQNRPAVFYGGLLLMGGAIAVVIVPSLSKRTLCRLGAFSVTAGLAVKVPLVMLGGYGVSHSVDRYCALDEIEPATAVGQYFVEREKIVEGGTAIVAASGIVMLSAETGFILAAHRASQAGRALSLAAGAGEAGVVPSGARTVVGALLAGGHPDELAILSATTDKTAHALAEGSAYLCQHDPAIPGWVCVEEGDVRLREGDLLAHASLWLSSAPAFGGVIEEGGGATSPTAGGDLLSAGTQADEGAESPLLNAGTAGPSPAPISGIPGIVPLSVLP